ncbi:MAG TPA: glycosyltransferase N-terminal domain-containing protein, partial [Ferruginibacter sp.]|nr:glycosyltransferase N-terminal domain-containing protein [Ferruginibacter sp.]
MLSKLLYNLFLVLYSIGVRIASLWNPKARKWINGRKDIFTATRAQLPTSNYKPIWMHCASLGEFEQGRPLLEAIKAADPSQKIVLSFFSPSGYEVMKDYKGADRVLYLPMDSSSNAKKFLDIVDPSLVLWVKYEYWYYYLSELKKRKIPTILVSGIFRKNQPFFAWYGQIWREMLTSFTHFFVQNEESKKLLSGLGISSNVTLNGGTRFDRVLEIYDTFTAVPHIAE